MKTFKPILPAAILALAMAACTNDDHTPGTPSGETGEAVEISAGISSVNVAQRGSDAAYTRATDAAWHAGDAIGLYMYNTGTQTVTGSAANRRYITAAGGATATFAPDGAANTVYFPIGGAEVDLLAYYPHNPTLPLRGGSTPQGGGGLPVDVSAQANLPAIDLMTSNLSTGHNNTGSGAKVDFKFAHRLSKISLTLKRGQGTENIDLGAATVTLGGTTPTGVYNLYEQKFQSLGPVADINLVNNGAGKVTAIVVPTAEGATDKLVFTINAGGETFIAEMPAGTTFKAGREARTTITLNHLNPEIKTDIVDWTAEPETEVDVFLADAFTSERVTLPGDGEIKLTVTDNNTLNQTYDYTYINDVFASTAPLYWESLPKYVTGTGGDFRQYDFGFTYTPDADGTPAKDVLRAVTTGVQWGKSVVFELMHVHTAINVTIKRGTGYTAGPEWDAVRAGIIVKLEGIAPSYPLIQAATQPDENIRFGQAIVMPKSPLAPTDLISITYGEYTYTALLSSLTDINTSIDGGKAYNINLTLNKTGIGISEIKIENFEGVNADGNIGYNE